MVLLLGFFSLDTLPLQDIQAQLVCAQINLNHFDCDSSFSIFHRHKTLAAVYFNFLRWMHMIRREENCLFQNYIAAYDF